MRHVVNDNRWPFNGKNDMILSPAKCTKGKKQRMAEEEEEEMELIGLAIRKLMEEKDDGADDHQLLFRLLSQVESKREEQRLKQQSQLSAQQENEKIIETGLEIQSENVDRVKAEEIVKELKEVKRQNFITHCLVSAMIILTVSWQVCEVSLILKLKDGLSNPFKFLGRILKRKTNSAIKQQIEATDLPNLNIPAALPHVNLPDLDFDEK